MDTNCDSFSAKNSEYTIHNENGSAHERPPLLEGVDSKDVPATFRALNIDLDLYIAIAQRLSNSEMLAIELSVLQLLMHH